MRKISILLLPLCIPIFLHADVIHLKSGRAITGDVLERNPEYIRLDVGGGVTVTYFFDEVDYIEKEKKRPKENEPQMIRIINRNPVKRKAVKTSAPAGGGSHRRKSRFAWGLSNSITALAPREYDNHTRSLKEELISSGDGVHSVRRVYWPDGTLMREEELSGGVANGKLKTFHNNGKLCLLGNMKNGKREGMYKEFYENGTPRASGAYADGKAIGRHIRYFKNGKVSHVLRFKGGRLDGKCMSRWENGRSKAEASYRDGNLNGTFLCYYENGPLRIKASFKDGIPAGPFVYYRFDGTVNVEARIVDGSLTQTKTFDASGRPLSQQVDEDSIFRILLQLTRT